MADILLKNAVKRMEGYLYYVDGKGNIVRAKMQRKFYADTTGAADALTPKKLQDYLFTKGMHLSEEGKCDSIDELVSKNPDVMIHNAKKIVLLIEPRKKGYYVRAYTPLPY